MFDIVFKICVQCYIAIYLSDHSDSWIYDGYVKNKRRTTEPVQTGYTLKSKYKIKSQQLKHTQVPPNLQPRKLSGWLRG